MSVTASQVIERLRSQIAAIASAAELADDESVPMEAVYAAIQKCMAVDYRATNMTVIYESILVAAASNRAAAASINKRSEDVASVYFIRRDDGLVKIGYSHNPTARLSQLKQQHQCGMTLLATIRGARRLEKELHSRFSRYRVQGEWFSPSQDLLDFIAGATTPTLAS